MGSIFPLSRCQRNLVSLFSWYKTLCKTEKNACKFHLCCWNHVCKVNELCLGNCFHRKFRVSTKIMVCNYCIANCRKYPVCSQTSMAFQAILFFFFFVTKNVLNRTLVIMKTMCPPTYNHNDFAETHTLGHMMYSYTLLVPINQRVLKNLSKEHNVSGQKRCTTNGVLKSNKRMMSLIYN